MGRISELRAQFRARIGRGDPVLAPGVFDALSAKLAAAVGFEAVYASGGAIARSTGVPDLGLLTLDEMAGRIREIAAAVTLPVIADADTGYGNALHVQRTVQRYEQAGVAALHLEDQPFPKRCGHYDRQEVIAAGEMVGKLRAALDARTDPNLLIIARTDARAAVGLDEAMARARAYAAAGADLIFVEALRSTDELRAVAAAVCVPLLYNMTYSGKSPLLAPEALAALGFRVIIYPADLQLAAIRGMRAALEALRRDGMTTDAVRASWQEREALVELPRYLARSAQYAGETAVPE